MDSAQSLKDRCLSNGSSHAHRQRVLYPTSETITFTTAFWAVYMHCSTVCSLEPRRIEGVAALVTISLPDDLGVILRAWQKPIGFLDIICIEVMSP
jgi:hypothetical protein